MCGAAVDATAPHLTWEDQMTTRIYIRLEKMSRLASRLGVDAVDGVVGHPAPHLALVEAT